MGLELQIFVELFLLSHLFTFLLKFNFRRFIIDSIEIYVHTSGHILQPFRIHFLLATSVNEAVWQCVQFRIGLLAFFLLLKALLSILCRKGVEGVCVMKDCVREFILESICR